MKTKIIILILLLSSCLVNSQTDSTIINKINDHYVEVKSLRHVLSKGYSDTTEYSPTDNSKMRYGVYDFIDYTPRGPRLKDGVVLIKDRFDRPLALYVYSDSNLFQLDHYKEGRIEWQEFDNPRDSSSIDKYYWDNGNYKTIYYYNGIKLDIFHYDKKGQFIKPKE
jgi:hypothetical protein